MKKVVSVSYTHLDVYKRQMQRRAATKERVAEVDKEINMDDKEVMPVEDLELSLIHI